MILNTIALHNFMSYADERLDLTSVNVACLAGHNGAGKSALLDSITWAIWESARSTSDELIRLGQREMWVEVTFELEGSSYRIRRSRQRSLGKGGTRGMSKGTLELQVKQNGRQADHATDGDEQSYTSLTGSSMRETQNRINELLRMQYDTFINSVYLRQGKADEFTTRMPAERKQVLADILGLSYFDRLQELARERLRDRKSKAEAMEVTLSGLPELQQRLADIDQELKTLQPEIMEVSTKLDFYGAAVEGLKHEQQQMELSQQQLLTAENRTQELQADLEDLQLRGSELGEKLSALNSVLQKSPEIEQAARQFDNLKDRVQQLDNAASEIHSITNEKMDLQSQLAATRSRLEVEQEHWSSGLAELEKRIAALRSATEGKEKLEASYLKYKELLTQEAELAKRQEAFSQLTGRADELQSAVTEARIRLQAEVQQKAAAIEEMQGILASSQALQEEKGLLDREAEQLDKLEAEFELVEDQGLKAKTEQEQTQNEIADMKRRQKENTEKMRELHEHADSSICPLCASPIVDRLAVIERYKKENAALDSQIDQLEQRSSQLETKRLNLRKQYADLKAKLQGRKALDIRIGQFNEKQSALAKANAGLDKLTKELADLRNRLENQNFAQVERETLVAVKTEIHKLDYDPVIYSNLQSQIRAQRHVETRHQQMAKDLVELKKLEEQHPELLAKVAEVTRQLTDQSYAVDLQEKLQIIESKIQSLSYDRDQHLQLRQELASLIPSSELYREMSQARQEAPAIERALNDCKQSLQAKQAQLESFRQQLMRCRSEVDRLPEVKQQLTKQEEVLREFRAQRESLMSAEAVLQSRKRHVEEDLSALDKRRQQLDAVRAEIDDYGCLAEAFGKKGIQAVIIENAVPEIESEANRILSRLSDNQMHIALATQQKTKSGTVVETLELMIADELGTRNYELYSGGEAFKVDFAVRVALSRLLARRTGAKLETLIIDEGFGSQDEASRERMVRAINSIRSDFARILVITHISEMKEMFPVQILISKKSGTSRAEVVV